MENHLKYTTLRKIRLLERQIRGYNQEEPDRFVSFRVRREETIMLAVVEQNLLRTQVSTIKSRLSSQRGT